MLVSKSRNQKIMLLTISEDREWTIVRILMKWKIQSWAGCRHRSTSGSYFYASLRRLSWPSNHSAYNIIKGHSAISHLLNSRIYYLWTCDLICGDQSYWQVQECQCRHREVNMLQANWNWKMMTTRLVDEVKVYNDEGNDTEDQIGRISRKSLITYNTMEEACY